ncbi:MAG: hypothetical protein MUF19_00805 [Candidatus Pacebacteria bacterium]|jgi:hypothetical protein|nr:hypothetical protein [Candidatus Paceibacterota bacterium]
MEPIPTDQHELIIGLLRENQELLRANNELLLKNERRERRRFIFKVIWYSLLLGIPLFAYYYLYSSFVAITGGDTSGIQIPPGVLEQLIEAYTVQ